MVLVNCNVCDKEDKNINNYECEECDRYICENCIVNEIICKPCYEKTKAKAIPKTTFDVLEKSNEFKITISNMFNEEEKCTYPEQYITCELDNNELYFSCGEKQSYENQGHVYLNKEILGVLIHQLNKWRNIIK